MADESEYEIGYRHGSAIYETSLWHLIEQVPQSQWHNPALSRAYQMGYEKALEDIGRWFTPQKRDWSMIR